MNPILRRAAVSTAAAVALVGSAATITTADAAEHETTVVAIARTDTQPNIGNGLTPAGSSSGSALQGPNSPTQQMPTGVNEQVTTQASGGAIGAGVVAILILGIIVIVRVKGKDVKAGDAVVLTLFGIAVSGTVIGAMGDQVTTSLVSSLGGVLGGL